MPKISVLHVRDPDGYCDLRVFLDGEEVEFSEESVDAGAGHEADEWRRRIAEYEAEPPSPFRDAALAALSDPPGAKYIDGWGTEEKPTCPWGQPREHLHPQERHLEVPSLERRGGRPRNRRS